MRILSLFGVLCGILSGLGMILGAILIGSTPWFAWVLIAAGFLISAAIRWLTRRSGRLPSKADDPTAEDMIER